MYYLEDSSLNRVIGIVWFNTFHILYYWRMILMVLLSVFLFFLNENVPKPKDLVQKYKTGKEMLLLGSWIRNTRQSQSSAPHDNLFGVSEEHFFFF